MTTEHPIRLRTEVANPFVGSIDDLLPDLSDFFPHRSRPAPLATLPLCDDRELRTRNHTPPPIMPPHVDVTERKRKALAMSRQGWTTTMIAARLGISPRTVSRWRAEAVR